MKTRRLLITAAVVVTVIALVLSANFIPTWNLKTKGMQKISGEWVSLYYEKEKTSARDMFCLADSEAERLAKNLGLTENQKINIYVYDSQKTMQTKKYGFIAPLLSLSWYIGDNIGTDVIITTPANPGKEHNYNSVKNALPHEMVHAYISVINRDISLWLTEGVALYLTNGEPFRGEWLEYMAIPSYRTTQSNNPLTFSNENGYTFAHTYIEYLDKTYGWNKVLSLIKTENYPECFGKSEKEIYTEWVCYLQEYYQ